ncbi:MAG: DUF2793 domain-containing protein [Pseudomonadota bacterium]
MSDNSPLIGMPLVQPSQAQKHVTVNEALMTLDTIVQLTVAGAPQNTPPGAQAVGAYLVGPEATGAWQGHDGQIATWQGTFWRFQEARPGWRANLRDTGEVMVFDGTVWQQVELQNMPLLGVNAAADDQNRLTVASPNTLLTHEGSGHQLKLNKATESDTVSVLFQSDWTGHAELGLTGNDDLSFRISPDGSAWTTALRIDASTGDVSGASVQQDAQDASPGRLMLAEHGLLRSDIVGMVTGSATAPGGALFESGTTANGTFMKFANGLALCSRSVSVTAVSTAVQDFDLPLTLATVIGGSVIGADPSDAEGNSGLKRVKILEETALWVDQNKWRVRYENTHGIQNFQVILTALGTWQ